jgi:hypothetical protein
MRARYVPKGVKSDLVVRGVGAVKPRQSSVHRVPKLVRDQSSSAAMLRCVQTRLLMRAATAGVSDNSSMTVGLAVSHALMLH